MYGPMRYSRSDAVALAIHRGRDFGVPSYNQVRVALNMQPVQSWEEINLELYQNKPQVCVYIHIYSLFTLVLKILLHENVFVFTLFVLCQLFRELSELYGNDINKLELFIGALLESKNGSDPVVSSILLDQFERIRNADRFWFENKQNG